MNRIIERGAGLDVHKDSITACVRIPDPAGQRHQETRTFGTTTRELLALRDWLVACAVTVVGMESTGVYWKPVYYLLEEELEAWLLNAHPLKAVPGRKTDVQDAEWVCQLVEHGLVRPSFVPPRESRELRDLTRYRKALIQERTREAQRLDKVLQDAGIKLSSVASEVLGRSGRALLAALIEGGRDPVALADLAKGRLRQKLPGVDQRAAQVILAEIGADMTRFPTARHLASWAGRCPGNNESAGKHRPERTRKGSKWLATTLVESATAVARSKHTYLASQYARIKGRRGHKKALGAVAHSILVIAYHILQRRRPYAELGSDYLLRRNDAEAYTQRLVRQLERLGHKVSLQPLSPAV